MDYGTYKISDFISKYKGIYRLKAPVDLNTGDFVRDENGVYSEDDVYIDCYKNIQIYYYGGNVLTAYIPSLRRGSNIIKNIYEMDNNLIFGICKTDEEVTFNFSWYNDEIIFPFLIPKTNGASISPFSKKNLPKIDYVIPEDDLNKYKKIIENVEKKQYYLIANATRKFLISLEFKNKKKSKKNKKSKENQNNNNLDKKRFKNKEYIHSIGKWDEYILFLKKFLKDSEVNLNEKEIKELHT